MSGIQGMTQLSLQELRERVAPLITQIVDDFFAEKWDTNQFGVAEKFTLKQLEAYRQFLGIAKLGKEEFFFLISRDFAMPEANCADCRGQIVIPIRWFALNEGGSLHMDSENFGLREFGQTAIIPDANGREFVAKFCRKCQAKRVLPSGSRWQSYAASLREIAQRVERRNRLEIQTARALRAKEKAEASAMNIAAMLGQPN